MQASVVERISKNACRGIVVVKFDQVSVIGDLPEWDKSGRNGPREIHLMTTAPFMSEPG
jgi:hypothetical protein